MTDRELLELAAKAAGIEGSWHEQNSAYASPTGWLMPNGHTWNPLTDDGDAFRLAVKCLPFHTLQYSREDYDHCQQDPYAATRRAIVRAAAEIGKGMV